MPRRKRRDERGITLILFTLMLTVMLVFVALAMDTGLVFNERRQDQSAVDAAVLAAAQVLFQERNSAPAAAKALAVNEIIRVTHQNTQSTNEIPLERADEWRARWESCSADLPLGFERSATSACIAFHDRSSSPGDTTKVWAHLPPMRVGSTFGGVVGIDEYTTTADATGEIFLGEPYAAYARAENCDQTPPENPVVEQVVDIGTNSQRPITIDGPVHSNGAVEISQSATMVDVNDFVTYVKSAEVPAQMSSRLTGPEDDPLADISINDYVLPSGAKAVAARLEDRYFNAGSGGVNDAWLDDTAARDVADPATGDLKNVLIYTTGPIELTRPRGGTATLVSTDRITFRGDGFNLSGRDGDVLAFSSAGDENCGGDDGAAIRFAGGNNTWNGVVYAPDGSIRSCSNVETSQDCSPQGDPSTRITTFNGGLIGFIVDVDSPGFVIKNQPVLGAPTRIRLFQ